MINNAAPYPATRLRRLRQRGWIREMVAEHHITPADLIWPVFVIEGKNERQAIPSMPGIYRHTIDLLIEELKAAQDVGIKAFALFPIVPTEFKDETGTQSFNPDSLICRALYEIKKALPDIGLIADVALDPYTTHGHDGLVKEGEILNDETLKTLCKQALVQAQAGADIIAPSDMMDGRVGQIRSILDQNDLTNTMIMAYAAKYASAFYGPFRDAVKSSSVLKGDKKTYQMNPANAQEALREVALDIKEGADMVMIKPGLPYLDIVRQVKDTFKTPTFAYHVSGEYAMLHATCEKGWMDYDSTLFETLLSFKRAGCDGILTYGAVDFAKTI